MAGCYGNSAEDRAMEADLFRFLASQADDKADRINDRVNEFWESASDIVKAIDLDFNNEITANLGGLIIWCAHFMREAKAEKAVMPFGSEMIINSINRKFQELALSQIEREDEA